MLRRRPPRLAVGLRQAREPLAATWLSREFQPAGNLLQALAYLTVSQSRDLVAWLPRAGFPVPVRVAEV